MIPKCAFYSRSTLHTASYRLRQYCMLLCISILSKRWQLAYCTAGNSWRSILECIICKLGNKHVYSVVVLQVRIIIIAKLKRNTKFRQDGWGLNKRHHLHVQLFPSWLFCYSGMYIWNCHQCNRDHFVKWCYLLNFWVEMVATRGVSSEVRLPVKVG